MVHTNMHTFVKHCRLKFPIRLLQVSLMYRYSEYVCMYALMCIVSVSEIVNTGNDLVFPFIFMFRSFVVFSIQPGF